MLTRQGPIINTPTVKNTTSPRGERLCQTSLTLEGASPSKSILEFTGTLIIESLRARIEGNLEMVRLAGVIVLAYYRHIFMAIVWYIAFSPGPEDND